MKKLSILFLTVLICIALAENAANAQTTEFTFQGSLRDGAAPANANYDFEFALFDSVTAGSQIGATIPKNNIPVANGIFSVKLDFGSVFPGANRLLEIRLRPVGQPSFTLLAPRQLVNSAPYSVKSLNTDNAATATNATQLGGVAAIQFVQTNDARLSDARNPLPNSGNYVQNTILPQASSNFNISGDGTSGGTLSGNAVNTTTQYNIGGNRILTGSSFFGNIFSGIGAGTANTTGSSNSFFGHAAGQSNVTGANNSFFGRNAGNSNTAGNNSFFGEQSGFGTSTGGNNSFFGQFAGRNNQTGIDNAFFGYRAGANNTASGNSFFGSGTGDSVTSGANNAFFGRSAGGAVITSSDNSFFGYNAGLVNTANSNSFFGARAGDSNTTGSLNAFFGEEAGAANVSGANNSFFGTFAGSFNTASGNSFFGRSAGIVNTTGANNTFVGNLAGDSNSSGGNNVFIGNGAGSNNTTGSNNTAIGAGADILSGLTFATAIGAGAVAVASNTIWIGRSIDEVFIQGPLTVQDDAGVNGTLRLGNLGSAGSTNLCQNASSLISTCSSSLRYKTNVLQYTAGLDVVRRLRPISFDWKDGGMKDVGFGAEDVANVDPRFVTYNDKGEVEGVKYDRLSVAFVNAFKEQQAQIEAQKKMIESQQKEFAEQKAANQRLQSQMDELKTVVCTLKPDVEICK